MAAAAAEGASSCLLVTRQQKDRALGTGGKQGAGAAEGGGGSAPKGLQKGQTKLGGEHNSFLVLGSPFAKWVAAGRTPHTQN